VVGKNGPKLRLAKSDAAPAAGPAVPGHIASNQMSMLTLATLLPRFQRQTVVDMTGLSGLFEVNLEWAPENQALPSTGTNENLQAVAGESRPSLFSVVQEQLGSHPGGSSRERIGEWWRPTPLRYRAISEGMSSGHYL
jgi:uncharacterized protein (TIGR03435 family)